MAIAAVLDIVMRTRTGKAEQGIKRTQAAIKGLAKTVAAGAAAFVAYRGALNSLRGVVDLERNLAKSTALVLDMTDAQKQLLKTQALVKGLDPNIAANAADIAKGYEFLFLAGLDVEKALLSIERVAKFATAGSFDLARATDLATDTLSAMGLAAKDTEGYLANLNTVTDAYALAASTANATIEQFAEAILNQAAGQLKLFNKSIEEGLAILAAYANAGVKGTEAGTKLAVVLRDLSRAATLNSGAFKAAGIAVFGADNNFRNFADVLADIEKSLDGLSDLEKIQKLLALGIPFKSLSALSTLLGQSDAIRDYFEALKDADDVVNRMATKTMPEFDRAIKTVTGAWRVFTSAVVTPILEGFAATLNYIVESLKTGSGKLSAWVLLTATLTPLFATLGTVILKVSTALFAVAKGSALAQAFTGPRGWANLAVGAAAAAGAIALVNNEITSVVDQVGAFEELAEKQRKLADAGKDAAENAEGLANAMDNVQAGAAAAAAETSKLQSIADKFIQAQITPWQRYLNLLQEIRKVTVAGLLDDQQARRALADALKNYVVNLDINNISNPTGARFGSQEAAAKRFGAAVKTQIAIQEEQLRAQEETVKVLEQIEQDFKNRPPVPIVPAQLGN